MSNEKLKQCADFLENLVIPGFEYSPRLWVKSPFYPLVNFGLLTSVKFEDTSLVVIKREEGKDKYTVDYVQEELGINGDVFEELFNKSTSFKDCAARIRKHLEEAGSVSWNEMVNKKGWYTFHPNKSDNFFFSLGSGIAMMVGDQYLEKAAEAVWTDKRFKATAKPYFQLKANKESV